MDSVEIRSGRAEDFDRVAALLSGAGLPIDGLRDHFADSWVALRKGSVVGCVALEVYPGVALLRSLVVSAGERGRGLGERLTAEALRLARERGAREVYLLTETAREFFPRFGFAVADREVAPASLRESAEFQSACPASAILMRRSVA
jgi:amino-acid N-acetyltransferase